MAKDYPTQALLVILGDALSRFQVSPFQYSTEELAEEVKRVE